MKELDLSGVRQEMDQPGDFQLALNTIGMALDNLFARLGNAPSGTATVDLLRRQVADLDKRFGQSAEAIHDRLSHLERITPTLRDRVQRLEEGKPTAEGLPADDRFATLAADQEKGFLSVSRSLGAIRERLDTLERRPSVGADYTFVPSRDEFARLAAQVAAQTAEIETLRHALEAKHRSDLTWRDSIGNILGLRRPPRGG